MAKKKEAQAEEEKETTTRLWGWRRQSKSFLVGVPARDITADEAREKDLASTLDDSPLYRRDYVEVAE